MKVGIFVLILAIFSGGFYFLSNMNVDKEGVVIKASGVTRMLDFEAVLKDGVRKGKDVTLINTDNGESVEIKGLSRDDRVEIVTMAQSLVNKNQGHKDNTKVSIVGIAGNVLGARFADFNYSYAHLDGRGMEHFVNSFDEESEWCLGLGSLKETTLEQFIKGIKVYLKMSKKIVPVVDNNFMVEVFSEGLDAGVVNVDFSDPNIYRPEMDDFPARLSSSE